jgi:hypothetical protein
MFEQLKQHQKEKISVHATQQQPAEKKLVGRLRPLPGQIVWELDLKTHELKEAEYISAEAVITKYGTATKRTLIVKPYCMYEVAINKKNAERKLLTRINKLQ